jgi:glutamate racemase
MAERPVAFIDSGIGGLPYVSYTRALLPSRRYVHVADRGNFPYGSKTADEIISSTVRLAEGLVAKEHPALIVVACNTMSVVALAELRARIDLPFVGVVPAVKPAAALSKNKRVGILATPRTVEGEYLKDLVSRFADGCSIAGLSAQDLVQYVETQLYRASPQDRRKRVRVEADRFRAENVDTVVLACTHFLHLEEEFRIELGPGVTVVDSREGVARQVLRLLGGAHDAVPSRRRDSLYVTGNAPVEERYAYFASAFGMSLERLME